MSFKIIETDLFYSKFLIKIYFLVIEIEFYSDIVVFFGTKDDNIKNSFIFFFYL